MALKVFISGVSGEFEDGEFADSRTDLANCLHSLGIHPIVQESLREPAYARGTVGKLVRNVGEADMVVCLIGRKAGYPYDLEARLRIQKLAEEDLKESHDIDDPGEIWSEWRDLGHGMTYTQLEFFLAVSGFRGRERKQRFLMVMLVKTKETEFDEAQEPFFDFVRKQKDVLNRDSLSGRWEARVLADIVGFSQRRDNPEFLLSASVPANEALKRSLAIAQFDEGEQRLDRDSYSPFLYVLQRRLKDRLQVLDYQSESHDIGDRRADRGAVAVIHGVMLCFVMQTSKGLKVFEADLSDLSITRNELLKGSAGCYPVSLTRDGSAVLAIRGSQTILIPRGNPPKELSRILKLDTFAAGLPALTRTSDGLFWIREHDDDANWEALEKNAPLGDRELQQRKEIESAATPHPIFLLFQKSSVLLPGSDAENSVAMYVDDPTALLPRPFGQTAIACPRGSTAKESLVMRRYGTVPLIDLFECDRAQVLEGSFLRFQIKSRPGGALQGCVLYNSSHGDGELNLTLAERWAKAIPDDWHLKSEDMGNWASEPHPAVVVGKSRASAESGANQTRQPKSAGSETVEFPYPCKYRWYGNEFLITVQNAEDGAGFTARAFRFPRPVESAKEFIEQVSQWLEGSNAWEASEEWRHFLRSLS